MNRSTMTTEELLQLAGADLLGVLEDDERQRFERAFLAASPAVQETIRCEQAQAAECLLATLPHVDPPMRMRQEVLEQVLAASGSEATLRLVGSAASTAARPSQPSKAASSETRWRDAAGQATVSRYWRAACMALIGLSLALVVLYRDARVSVDALAHVLKKESWATNQNLIVRYAGVPYAELHVDPATVTVRFEDRSGTGAVAAFDYNEQRQQGFLELHGLNKGRTYELCYMVDESDKPAFVHRFEYESQIYPVDFAFASLPGGGRWEIRERGSREALLVGRLA